MDAFSESITQTLVPSVRTDKRILALPKYAFFVDWCVLLWLPAELNFYKSLIKTFRKTTFPYIAVRSKNTSCPYFTRKLNLYPTRGTVINSKSLSSDI